MSKSLRIFFLIDLSIEVASKIKGVPPGDIAEILDTILSLYFSGFHHDMPPEQLAGDVIEAMLETQMEEFQLSNEKQEWFKERLIRVFKIETLLVVAKALGVLQDNEKTFCGARILTDIRPVFAPIPLLLRKQPLLCICSILVFIKRVKSKTFSSQWIRPTYKYSERCLIAH